MLARDGPHSSALGYKRFDMGALNQGFEYRRRLGAEAAGLQAIEYLTVCYGAFTREEWLARRGWQKQAASEPRIRRSPAEFCFRSGVLMSTGTHPGRPFAAIPLSGTGTEAILLQSCVVGNRILAHF